MNRDIQIRVWEGFSYRIDIARASGGGHFEDI